MKLMIIFAVSFFLLISVVNAQVTNPGHPADQIDFTVPIEQIIFDSSMNDKIVFRGTQADPHTIYIEGTQGLRIYDDTYGEIFRITESGNIGIGTISPGGRLHVFGGTGDSSVILPSGSIGSTEIISSQIQRRLLGSCSGQVLVGIDENGNPQCEADDVGGGDGFNPDNQPGYGTRGEPTRDEIEAWGDAFDDYAPDTNANTICTGTNVYLDGDGNCDTVISGQNNCANSGVCATVYAGPSGRNYLGNELFAMRNSARTSNRILLGVTSNNGWMAILNNAGNTIFSVSTTGIVKAGNPSHSQCNGLGDLCADDRLVADNGIYSGGLIGGGNLDVYWDSSSGRFATQSSSERYKTNIRNFEEDYTKILEAQPKKYTRIVDGMEEIGFIAEEFEDLGLNHLVIYRDGLPESIAYEKIPLYLLEIIKDQQDTAEMQQQEINKLKETVCSIKPYAEICN